MRWPQMVTRPSGSNASCVDLSHREVLNRVKQLVPDAVTWRVLNLMANDGLTQAQAAGLLGVSTRTLIQKLNVLRRLAQENAIQIG